MSDPNATRPHETAEAYIPGDRRHALGTGRELPDRVRGAALFADISGFTPLTETLAKELGPQRGAEELTAHLNRVFQALISELDRFGGLVVYFSGDAITCWIDGDDGARATAEHHAGKGEVVLHGGRPLRAISKRLIHCGKRDRSR
ncbi:MAG: hypothetical protein ABJC33_01535 [Betaproteobacteria bacterium]